MEIHYLGLSSFKLKGRATALTDPYSYKEAGVKLGSGEIHVVTVSGPRVKKDYKNIEGKPVELPGSGEYEVHGIQAIGISDGTQEYPNMVFHFEIDGVNILHAGYLNKKLDEKEIERLGVVDIVLVPVGGSPGILPTSDIVDFVAKVEPSIVIPMLYSNSKFDPKKYPDLGDLREFLKQMGKESNEPLVKLSVTKDKLPDEMQVMVLQIP